MSTVRERVEKGAALLDEHAPGWENVIDLKTLELASCQKCICGQVALAAAQKSVNVTGLSRFRGWTPFNKMCRFFAKKLGLPSHYRFDASEYGFDTQGNRDTYLGLEREWARLIRARLKAKAQ